jgi:Spy/CpxP family protein refolding chaperone
MVAAGETPMHKKSIVTLLALVCTVPAWAADAPDSTSATAPTQEQVMQQFRDDLQATAADVMAKGLTLTADQAAKFWPMFQTFQNEQKAIIDDQLRSLVKYRDTYKSMTDADALAYINALLERDQNIHDLRMKYLTKFQEVVPTRVAARAIQIDRRPGLVGQVKISSQVPLIP